MIFDQALWRFGTSGTLLLIYGVVEGLAKQRGAGMDRPGVPPPRVLKVGILIALSAFYLLIKPTGYGIAGGWGNLGGIVLALGAVSIRYAARNGWPGVRHPAIGARLAFYTALPLAVGTPWGFVALTLPAYALWAYCSWREDRILSERLGEPYLELMARTRRLIPGVW